jgi:ATP-dependent phosphofructokinase / diphosphate-dependent phosphofructokinase
MLKRVGILTGGGDCPGLNAVIRAVVRKFLSIDHVEVMGILRGWRGLIDGLIRPLDINAVSGILPLGGTILRTSHVNPFSSPDGAARIMDMMKSQKLEGIIVIGGEDTLTVAARMYEEHRIPLVCIPKTIDNDLNGTEYSFGFDTTINIAMEAIDRIHTTAESHDRVMIVEVMGHNAGWIAMHSGLAGGADLILIPERPCTAQDVCDTIMRRHDRGKDFSIIVIAEGARISRSHDEEPRQYYQETNVDDFGNVRLGGVGAVLAKEIETRTGYQTRVTMLGHIQRGGTPTAFDRVLGTRFGVKACELLIEGKFGQMVALQSSKIIGVPLAEAMKTRKLVPDTLYDVAMPFFD